LPCPLLQRTRRSRRPWRGAHRPWWRDRPPRRPPPPRAPAIVPGRTADMGGRLPGDRRLPGAPRRQTVGHCAEPGDSASGCTAGGGPSATLL
jgi:hypothetical protein